MPEASSPPPDDWQRSAPVGEGRGPDEAGAGPRRSKKASGGGLDERQLRFERGLAALLLFVGYVWRRDLAIPLVAIGITIALVPAVGVRPFGVPFEQLIAPRIRAPRHWVPFRLARTDDLTIAVILAIATLFLLLDISAISRVIALVVALMTTFEAAAGLWIGAPLANRLRSRARPQSRSRRQD
jgi:hypothetical protein